MLFRKFQYFTLLSYFFMYEVQAFGNGHLQKLSPSEIEFWYCVFICSFLVCFSGFCSGATQGLLSIDEMGLQLKRKYGTQSEKQLADQILPVIQQHHLLLGTLLISNATCNESIPIFLHMIVPDWAAILISAFFVVLFGEVVPSAFTTGPDQLSIAVKLIPYVKFLQSVLYIICYPLSLFLDFVLGTHNDKRYINKDLKTLIKLHGQEEHHHVGQDNLKPSACLSKDQVQLINATMDLRDEKVTKQSISIEKVFMISADEKFSKELIHKIRVKGFSRIPVYAGKDTQQIMGTFNTKSMLKYSESDFGKAIRSVFQISDPLIISKDTSMLQLLILFQEKRKTLAFISNHPLKDNQSPTGEVSDSKSCIINPREDGGEIIGVICLNDVFEEMLDVELKDDDIHGTLKNDPFIKPVITNPRKMPMFEKLNVIKEENEGIEKGLELPLLKKSAKRFSQEED